MDDKLVPRHSELATLDGISLKPSETALLKQLDVTAQNSKTETSAAFGEEWLHAFAHHPAEAIDWAFREWRHGSPFMPTISEVGELLRAWHRRRRDRCYYNNSVLLQQSRALHEQR